MCGPLSTVCDLTAVLTRSELTAIPVFIGLAPVHGPWLSSPTAGTADSIRHRAEVYVAAWVGRPSAPLLPDHGSTARPRGREPPWVEPKAH